ncbi:hypothetical protein AB3S75_015395 [Citrus x aurantiifolia]
MSKGKEKIVEIDDDELGFLPSLLTDPAFDPGIPLEPLGPVSGLVLGRCPPKQPPRAEVMVRRDLLALKAPRVRMGKVILVRCLHLEHHDQKNEVR